MWSRPPSIGPCPSPQAHLPLLPSPIWTWAAHLLGSWAQNFLDCYLCLDCSTPVFGLLSSPLGHSSGAISFSKTHLFPTLAFILCPQTSCLSTFPVIKLCQNCPYAPPICLSQWTLRLRCDTQNLALLGFHHLDPHCIKNFLCIRCQKWSVKRFHTKIQILASLDNLEIQQHGCTSSPCDKGPLWTEHGLSISPQSPLCPCFSPEASDQNHLSSTLQYWFLSFLNSGLKKKVKYFFYPCSFFTSGLLPSLTSAD